MIFRAIITQVTQRLFCLIGILSINYRNTLYPLYFWRNLYVKVILVSSKISQKNNQILDRYLSYEALAEICQKFGWLFGRFEDTKFHFEIN